MIIYKATNQINNKIYIGQTSGLLETRKRQHINRNNNNKIYFHNAIHKYGADNFSWEVIRICDSIESLNAWEQYYILYYKSIGECYNLRSGGKNSLHSESTKKKMSIAKQNMSEETKKKMSVAKQNISEETKKKMSIAHIGKKASEETKNKLRIINKRSWAKNKNNMGMKGKHHSEITIEKIRQGNLGKIISEETKLKMSKIKLGKKRKPFTIKTKEKMRISALNRSEESKHSVC